MTVTRTIRTGWPNPALASSFPGQSWDAQTAWASPTAQARARWGRSGTAITVCGEVDAANADQLGDYVRRWVGRCEWLVLDFSGVAFMGTAGFRALQKIQAHARGRVHWALVPSPAVSRLLRICDPESVLPTAASMPDALARVPDSQL
ncbi:MAG TPA: STAS domain-containing protein [Mycobacterium sp.]|nr:STAS domain-containing protein [Mycobacterium sp.]